MFLNVKKCFNEPKYFLRLVAVAICICVACYQLSACFQKILHPPRATKYDFYLNKTLNYPAVTICRNPCYKSSQFHNYGVTDDLTYSSSWKNFNFQNYSLADFFEVVTFNLGEFISLYGFDGFDSNLTITTFYTLTYGKCFKFISKHMSPIWSSKGGYFFYMRHTEKTRKPLWFDNLKTNTSNIRLESVSMSGFHIFVHDRTEMFTENPNQQDSFTEYVYLQPGEELEVNLRPEEFRKISVKDERCNSDYDYTQSKCKEMCAYKYITETVGCYVPWMPNKKLELCNSYESVKQIIKLYAHYTDNPDYMNEKCNCIKSCKINIYSPFVRYRKDKGHTGSTLIIYFSSNLVPKMNEIMGYDWNLFLSDLGGSLGFLLGLSVLSAIGVIGQIFEGFIKKKGKKKEDDLKQKQINDIENYLKPNKNICDEINNKNVISNDLK